MRYVCALLLSATFFQLMGADFFPLRPGNSWTYRNAESGQSFQVEVGTPIMTNDRVYYSLRGFVPQRVLVRKNEYGNIVKLDEDSGQERILISFEPLDRAWWEAYGRPCEAMGQTAEKRGQHEGPVGPIEDTLEVKYRTSCADAGTESEQYAENIGLLRRVENTFAGPRQYDLVSARIGSATRIEALPYGRFSASVQQHPNSPVLGVLLSLDTNSSVPVVLRFPSAQELEVVLRDDKGNVVWRWSDGQFFGQSAHEQSISGRWNIPVAVPRPNPPGPRQTRIYTLQAWLTTEGPEPTFAVTVPLTVTSGSAVQ